jgi:hypothetical protein
VGSNLTNVFPFILCSPHIALCRSGLSTAFVDYYLNVKVVYLMMAFMLALSYLASKIDIGVDGVATMLCILPRLLT